MNNIELIGNKQLEKLSFYEREIYLAKIRQYCLKSLCKKQSTINELLKKAYPLIRNYDYEIIGEENVGSDASYLFLCNHSNSHAFFTAQEMGAAVGKNVSVFAANDDLSLLSKMIFGLADSTLLDRNDSKSSRTGITTLASKLMQGKSGVIFAEGTWNLHPYKPMQQIKIGAAYISAISQTKIIPTIFEYVEVPDLVDKEKNLYKKCVICFGKEIIIDQNQNLISQTLKIQKTIEELRLELWKKLDVKKDYTLLADKQRYVNHTYLKKFDAFGFTYDSESEQKHLFSSINQPVENEYILTSNNEFIPGVTLRRR